MSPPGTTGGTDGGGSARVRLLRAFAAADYQADAIARSALAALDSGDREGVLFALGGTLEGMAWTSSSDEEVGSPAGCGADALCIAAERYGRRLVRVTELRRRVLEMRGQGEAYKRKEVEFTQQLEQLFWDKEAEAAELRVQLGVLQDEREELRDTALQQDLEHDALQTQLEEMLKYRNAGEARVAALMDHLVNLLGRGDSSPASRARGGELLEEALADAEAHHGCGEKRLALFRSQLEEARRENRTRARRLSDLQSATTGIHTRMCQLQDRVLAQKLSPAEPLGAGASESSAVGRWLDEAASPGRRAEQTLSSAASPPGSAKVVESPEGTASSALGLAVPAELAEPEPAAEGAMPNTGSLRIGERDLAESVERASPPGSAKVVESPGSSEGSASSAPGFEGLAVPAELAEPEPAAEGAMPNAGSLRIGERDLAESVERELHEALSRARFGSFVFRVTGFPGMYRFGEDVYAAMAMGPDGKLFVSREGHPDAPVDDFLATLQEAETPPAPPPPTPRRLPAAEAPVPRPAERPDPRPRVRCASPGDGVRRLVVRRASPSPPREWLRVERPLVRLAPCPRPELGLEGRLELGLPLTASVSLPPGSVSGSVHLAPRHRTPPPLPYASPIPAIRVTQPVCPGVVSGSVRVWQSAGSAVPRMAPSLSPQPYIGQGRPALKGRASATAQVDDTLTFSI